MGFVIDDPEAQITLQTEGMPMQLERLAASYIYDDILPQEPADECEIKR